LSYGRTNVKLPSISCRIANSSIIVKYKAKLKSFAFRKE